MQSLSPLPNRSRGSKKPPVDDPWAEDDLRVAEAIGYFENV